MTKEEAIKKAKNLISLYPEERNSQKLIDLGIANGFFTDKNEILAVWGRVNRELRNA